MFKKLSFTLLGIVLVYASVAFAMKAGIGVWVAIAAPVIRPKYACFPPGQKLRKKPSPPVPP